MSFWELEAQLQPVLMRREYVEITAGLASAILLSQLVYWFKPGKNGKPKLTIVREGRYWLAKTRTEWFEECGLTLKMYRNAIADLVDLGLVEVRHWKFGNDRTSHYWLDLGALAALLEFHGFAKPSTPTQCALSAPPDGPFGHTPMSPLGTSECALSAHPIYTETTAENTAKITYTVQQAALGNAGGGVSHFGLEEGTENMVTLKASKQLAVAKYAGQTAGEMLKGLTAKKESASDVSDALHLRWKKEYGGVYGEFHGEVTMADKGKLGRIAKAIGKEKALEVITWAVRDWQKFAFAAKDQKGLGGAPERPVIGFLLQHYGVALEALTEASKVPTMADGTPYFKVQEEGWGTGWQSGVGQAQKAHPGEVASEDESVSNEPKGHTPKPVQSIANAVAGDDEVAAAMKELGLT